MTSSRREFLKTAAAGSLGLTSFAAFAGIPVGCELKTPTKWDMTTDVVVAGSGAAGMAAAICAIEQGVKVDVFEKEKENYGGCAFICGGILNLQGGTRLQKSQGSKDTPEAYYKRLTDPKDPQMRKNNRALMKKVSQLSPAIQEWLEARGVKFFEHYQSNSDSQHTATYHTIWWSDPGEARPKPQPQGGFMSGQGIMIPLRRHFESKGGQIHFGHKIVDVYKDDSGKVIGAKAEKTDGSIVNIRATRGVVLAGGSWKANVELRKISDPRFTENMFSSGWPFVSPDGSAILAGIRAGGMYIGSSGHDDSGQMRRKFGTSRYNWRKGSKYGCPGLEVAGKKWNELIFTNCDGDRFVEEVDRSFKSGKYWFYDLALVQPEQKIWIIFDDATARKYRWSIEEPVCEKGYAFSASSLAELAKQTGQVHLEKTVARYNKFVEQKKDEDFDRPAAAMTKKIEKAPFYAVRCVLGVHNLAGGLHVNENSQCIGSDGKVIPGLYAAGESAGDVHSFGVPRALITGQIAGMHIGVQKA